METPGSTRRPTRVALSDEVYEILLGKLVDGTVAADSVLNIDALARELGVSGTPVREALARLEATGLVQRVAHRGYRVAPLFTADELAQLMDARYVLEPALAELMTPRCTPELLATLSGSIDDLRDAPRGATFAGFAAYWRADELFHQVIAQNCGNQFLLRAYQALGGQIQRFRLFEGLGVTDAEAAVAEHTAVLTAIGKSDATAARDAMAAHIAGVRERALADRRQLE